MDRRYVSNTYLTAGQLQIVFCYRKCDKDALDNDAVSPLLLAVMWGRAGAVEALIDGGCEVHTTDKDGRSAVYWAAQEGHMDVLRVGYVCLAFGRT